jgi:hypothetical protein
MPLPIRSRYIGGFIRAPRPRASRQRCRRKLLLLALGAAADELVVVPLEAEAVTGCDLPLQDLERLELELDDLAAAEAHDVIVMLPPYRSLVTPNIARENGGLYNARLGEQRQRPVDGRLRTADAAPPEVGHEVLDGEMALALEDGIQDRSASRCQPQASRGEVAFEASQRALGRTLTGAGCERAILPTLIETPSHP